MPSNPAVGYSKPKPGDFKTRAAFLKALEVYMRVRIEVLMLVEALVKVKLRPQLMVVNGVK